MSARFDVFSWGVAAVVLASVGMNPAYAEEAKRGRPVKAVWSGEGKAEAIPPGPVREVDQYGLGLAIGEPTGITFQLAPANETMAMNGLAAYSFNKWLQFSFDFVFQQPRGWSRFFKKKDGTIDSYLGVGVIAAFNQKDPPANQKSQDDFIFGLRLPVGIETLTQSKKFQLYAEIAPGVQFINEFDLLIQFGVGFRYIFVE